MDMGSRDSNKTRSMDRRKFLFFASSAVAAGASALAVPRVGAQSVAYPIRPVSIVVTFAPGTAPDVLARIIAPELAAHLGQNVIVENKPGAGGSIGLAAVARAKNDGYILGIVSPTAMGINPAVYRNLPWDPLKDFSPITKLASTPNILLVPAQSPATSVQDLMRRMKERKKENSFQYASASAASVQHLEGALLVKLAGAIADHVPYRSAADLITALVTGQVDFGFASLASSGGFVKSGRVRALGITSAKPSALLPDVPSLSSAGLDVFEKTDTWQGVLGPKDMPDAVVQTLHRAFMKTLGNPAIQTKLASVGFDPVAPASAKEFALFIRDQVAFYADLVKTSGVSVD